MNNNAFSVDICVFCAMAEEAEAFIKVATERCGVSFKQGFSKRTGREYRYTTIQNNHHDPLTIQISWPPQYGPLDTGLHLGLILDEFQPRFVAMTGICAGDKKKVKLGDLIVAERAFDYDAGKYITDAGDIRHAHDANTYHPSQDILQYVQMFNSWRPVVAQLPRPQSKRQQREWLLSKLLDNTTPRIDDIPRVELQRYAPAWRVILSELQQKPDSLLTPGRVLRDPNKIKELDFGNEGFPYKDPLQCNAHIATIASGSAVRGDSPFAEVQQPVRSAVAIDMEGAAFYTTVADFPGIRSLLVKGVCDYADSDKDDTYHEYAALASATYVLCFIQEYVTRALMPRHHEIRQTEARNSLVPTQQMNIQGVQFEDFVRGGSKYWQLRQKILQIIYRERRIRRAQTFDREDLVRFIGLSWSAIEPEVTYLEEKGYIITKSRQIGPRIFHILNITAQGIDALETGRTVQRITVFISSPGDVSEERQIAVRVIERLNKLDSIASHYFFKPLAYEEVVPAVVGQGPQDVVDNYMMEAARSDIFVCILWQRMGTPVIDEQTGERFQSGTEYEFLSAYRSNEESGKPFILLYRGMKPSDAVIDYEQLERVQAFFRRFEGEHAELKGLYKIYRSNEEFEEILRHDFDAIITKNFG